MGSRRALVVRFKSFVLVVVLRGLGQHASCHLSRQALHHLSLGLSRRLTDGICLSLAYPFGKPRKGHPHGGGGGGGGLELECVLLLLFLLVLHRPPEEEEASCSTTASLLRRGGLSPALRSLQGVLHLLFFLFFVVVPTSLDPFIRAAAVAIVLLLRILGLQFRLLLLLFFRLVVVVVVVSNSRERTTHTDERHQPHHHHYPKRTPLLSRRSPSPE